MPNNAPLTGAQLIQLSTDVNTLGNLIRGILNDPNMNLSQGQSSVLSADLTSLSDTAANLATWGAQVVFADSDAAFTTISSATSAANAKVAQLKATVAKIDSVVNIVGAAVSLGVAFGTGNFVNVLSAAGQLGNVVANA